MTLLRKEGERMFGVVLWSDPDQNRAVIWCEDHGNLAFLSSEVVQGVEACAIEAGDLVRFDIVDDGKVRRAENAQLVEPGAYPQLVSSLQTAADRKKQNEVQKFESSGTKVVPIDVARARTPSRTGFLQNGHRLRSI
ncbi:hypothetical protein ROA7450_03642 [Roseovarius albus]|uniref:Uncharacterized protein n=2 Tax=Roseovarius albus TaxID=1247867 RepID=A0A1X7A1C9_9RHOB|nr:hypothetical protein ROA7450_03642 [Roseovarius albus]